MAGAPTRQEDGVTIPAPRIDALCKEQVRRLYTEAGSQRPTHHPKGGGARVSFAPSTLLKTGSWYESEGSCIKIFSKWVSGVLLNV